MPDQSKLLTAKGVSFFGGYGELADPESALDRLFASMNAKGQAPDSKDNPLTSELIGEPEAVDIDGAAMKCQAAKSTNVLTKKTTNTFCAWVDYSTITVVSPGDNTTDRPPAVPARSAG
jgi:hypothetical protein